MSVSAKRGMPFQRPFSSRFPIFALEPASLSTYSPLFGGVVGTGKIDFGYRVVRSLNVVTFRTGKAIGRSYLLEMRTRRLIASQAALLMRVGRCVHSAIVALPDLLFRGAYGCMNALPAP